MLLADTLIVVGLATASLGTIHETDGIQEHTFWLRNDGQEAVSLMQGYTSCGCTTIHFAKEQPVAVGDSTSVTLRFNPRGKGGDFEETGTIVYTAQPAAPPTARKRLHLTLEGVCITSEETLLKQFPVRINEAVRLSTDHFDLGRMQVGEKKERNVVILLRDGGANRQQLQKLTFQVDAQMPKGLQHFPRTIIIDDRGKKIKTTVTFDVFIK